jgi:serine/threonine protein kinase
MRGERWQLIEEIFHGALERPSSGREAFLARACGSDMELRYEIESLLSNDAGAARVLDSLVAHDIGDLAQPSLSESGMRLGPYRLVRRLDSGGMGIVYLAVRSDDHYFQVVAIKMLREGMNEPNLVQRFRTERQILASLTHPNIGAILDGGETEDGRPFIVMEYVEGQPITQASENRGLSVKQRLDLFRSVCSAVHYAHEKLVIHRDIKPSNVLVTPQGIVKLIDFGVSKPLAPWLIPGEIAKTQSWQRFMTPDYASPEQLLGQELTTATDIYSLGVLLFELSTGSRPYTLQGLSASAAEKLVCEQPAPKPSSVPDLPDHTRRELEGDLDRITLMAMDKDASRRYRSAQHLEEDLHRFLQGKPVLAREATLVYKLGKFVRRHKTASLMTCLTVIVITSSILFYFWQSRLADRRVKQVETLADSAILDLTETLKQSPATTEMQASLHQSALKYLEQLRRSAGDDPRLLLKLSRAYGHVGDLEGSPYVANLGNSRAAVTSYEASLRTAVDARARLPGAESTKAVVEAYQRLGALEFFLGEIEKAHEDYQQSLSLAREFWQQQPEQPDRRLLLAMSYARLGDLQLDNLETDKALNSFRQAFQFFGTDANGEVDHDETLMRLYIRMGGALMEHGTQPEALVNLRQSIAVAEGMAQKSPAANRAHLDLLEAYIDIVEPLTGTDTLNVGDAKQGEAYARKALAIAEMLTARDSKNVRARTGLTFAYEAIGDSLHLLRPAVASEWYRKSLSLTKEMASRYPPGSEAQHWIALRNEELAAVLKSRELAVERLHLLEEANGVWKDLVAASPGKPQYRMSLMRSYCKLSNAELAASHLAQARRYADSALPFFDEFKPDSQSLLVLRDVGFCYEALGNVRQRVSIDHSFPASERRTARVDAHQWYLKSAGVWKEWNARGAATPESEIERRRVDRLLGASGALAGT